MESVDDVLDEIAHTCGLHAPRAVSHPGIDGRGGTNHDLGELEQRVLGAVGHDPVTLDQLVDCTRTPAGSLAATLLALEIDGWLEALPGNRYVRTSAK